MKSTLALLIMPLALAFAETVVQSHGAAIVVEVRDLKNEQGQLRCLLFATEHGFPDESAKALQQATTRIVGGAATCRFVAVPAGTYAVSYMHDENDNGELDTNFFGVPKEGWGASNDVRGMSPSFEDARFAHDGSERVLRPTTKY